MAALVLPWAKEVMPDAYQKTVAVVKNPTAFRKYIVRLVELRYEKDPDFRLNAPLAALEETGIRQKMKHPQTGTIIEVCGNKVEGRTWGFGEMAAAIHAGLSFESVFLLKKEWDLEVVPNPKA